MVDAGSTAAHAPPMLKVFPIAFGAVVFAGCAVEVDDRDDDDVACVDGATVCVDGDVSVCTDGVMAAPVACAPESACRVDACEVLSPTVLAAFTALDAYALSLNEHGSLAFELDDAVAAAKRALGRTDGDDVDFARAVTTVFLAQTGGHTSIGFGPDDFSACGTRDSAFQFTSRTWYAVCGRADNDGAVVVSGGDPANGLGLAFGDRVVGVVKADGTAWTLETMLDAVDREPLCRASIPNPIARRDVAASTLFNVIDVGDVLTVVDVDGGTREVVAPARNEQPRSCSDPLTRASRVHVRDVYQRDDGVVVVVLPTLGSHSEHPFPPNMDTAAYAAWIAEGVQAIGDEVAAFDDDVTGLVYDLRGNVGGSAEFGMALLAQLTDVEGSIGNCFARTVGSDPVRYDDDVEYPFPYAALDGASMPAPPITRLPAGTKQAVLTDGLTYSAGDWMAYHAHQLGIDVVGTPAAGAFGYTVGGSFVIDPIVAANDEHLDIINFISGAHCVYGADATSMEGNSVVDVEVTFDAADLAAGIDTQLEAAVDVVLR